jgi:hypothetical protein
MMILVIKPLAQKAPARKDASPVSVPLLVCRYQAWSSSKRLVDSFEHADYHLRLNAMSDMTPAERNRTFGVRIHPRHRPRWGTADDHAVAMLVVLAEHDDVSILCVDVGA